MDATNRNTALASVFTDELARCGLERAVICPGSRSTPLALALSREPRIETTVVIDERSAAFVALGMATGSAQPVAILTTSGTAAANLHPAVCEADLSLIPLIVLTADRPPELRGIGAGQTIDQIKLYGDAVRWFCEAGSHDADDAGLLHFRSIACRAMAFAGDEARPGPVHLNLPWRDPLGPEPDPDAVRAGSRLARDGRDGGRPLTAQTLRSEQPPAAVVESAAAHVAGVRKGVIVAGRQTDPAIGPALAELSAATGFPVLAEPTSQARRRAAGAGLIWAYDWIARLGPVALLPELILRFGELPTSKALRGWLANDGVEQIAVAPSGWNDPTSRTSGMIRAGCTETAEAFTAALGASSPKADGNWAESWRTAQAAAETAIGASLEGTLTEPDLHRVLPGLYGAEELVYTASSMPIRDQEFFAGPSEAALFLANRGANGIDGLVSSGIGAAIATGRPAWIITGDLGFVHDANALMQLAAAPAPVRIVVINNRGGGIFEHLPQASQLERPEFERLFVTPSGVDLVALCAAHGADYARIEELGQLDDLPSESVVLEVPTDGRADAGLRSQIAERTRDAIVDALSLT